MSSTTTNGAPASLPAGKITLRSSDGGVFDVEESIAMEFATVKGFFEEDGAAAAKAGTVVPLPNVSGKYLSLIIEYCREQQKLSKKAESEEEKKKYDESFVGELGNEDIKEMILAVNFLDVKGLLEVLNQEVADRIKNWSVRRVREYFGVENDFTAEEEEKIRQEHAWAHENVED